MTIEEAARYVLQQAEARGVAAEVLGEQSRRFNARAWHGRLDQTTQAVQRGLGVRVVVDGRVGYAYSEELAAPALDWMLTEALENAALQDTASGFIPAGVALGRHDLLGNGLAASLEAKVQTALGFEATLREDRRVKEVSAATYAEVEHDVTVASTMGATGSYRRGIAGIIGSVVMEEGTSRKQGWEAEWVTQLQVLDPGRTALTLTEGTARMLGARPLRTGRYPAYIEPKAFAELLAYFWHLWSGKTVMEGKSRLQGQLGKAVAASIMTLIDDPMLPDGLARRPFDAEGTPCQRVTLVEAGVLKTYLTNSETARALRIENNGHAARRYRDVLGVAPSNLYVHPGTGVSMRRGVLVTEMMGLHAGTDPISGEFSVQALGQWVDEGQVAYPVEDFAVAGDFLSLLERITALGEALSWELAGTGGAAFGAPLVEVADLSFAGK